jgi:hypothetical protein
MAHFWHTPSLADIEEQKHWELDGVNRGVARVRAEIDGQKVADSALGSALSQQLVPNLVAEIQSAQKNAELALIESSLSKGRVNPLLYMLLLLPAETLAVITVKRTLSAPPREFTFNQTITTASDIDRTVRDQLDYEDWLHEDRQMVERFFQNYELSPRNLKRLRDRVGRRRQERWDKHLGIQFGTLLLELMAKSKPEWFRIEQARLRGGRWEYQLVVTETARDALFKLSEQCELSQPAHLPTIIPPADWRAAA